MKKIILFILFGTLLCSCNNNYKEGDIVFQISKSKQSPFIMLATHSIYTHCGVIIEKQDELYVLEAVGPVKLTPFEQWKDRGRFNHVHTRRITTEPIKVKYKQYLGQSYDFEFKFNNNKMYCSELVYLIYKNQFDTILAEPKRVSDYHLLGLDKIMSKRNIDKEQLVIAPSDLL